MEAEGKRLHRRIKKWAKDENIVFDPHEEYLIDELCRTADRLATFREAIAELSPADVAYVKLCAEERQQRVTFGRLVGQLGFPTGIPEEDTEHRSAKSRNGLKGARSRWNTQQAVG